MIFRSQISMSLPTVAKQMQLVVTNSRLCICNFTGLLCAFLSLSSSATVAKPAQSCIAATNCGSHVTWECGKQFCCQNHVSLLCRQIRKKHRRITWSHRKSAPISYKACHKYITKTLRDSSCSENGIAKFLLVYNMLLHRLTTKYWNIYSKIWWKKTHF